jgi:hypothetical protein
MTTNNASFTFEVKSMIAMAKSALDRKKKLFSPSNWTYI